MPIDTLKSARTIVAPAQSLNPGVIAGDVATEGVRDLLASFGCDCHQGQLYSRPVAPEALAYPAGRPLTPAHAVRSR